MEEAENLEPRGRIDSKYLIKEKLGSGGQANVFLVTKEGDTQEYAAKVFKKKSDSVTNEINILQELKEYQNPYIIEILDSGEGDIVRNHRDTKKMKYFVLEHMPNGNIFDYIYAKKSGLGEQLSKILFQQILYGVQCCHKHNICHRDIKLENILLNDKYIPKICDFGLACLNTKSLTRNCGTDNYKPPEINGTNIYDGIKVDIFYLASTLMILTTGLPGFILPKKDDPFFIEIMKENSESYWKKVDKQMKAKDITLSKEFKDLYFKMISIKPKKRPNIDEILEDPWFKEIDDMKINEQEKFEELNNKISEIFCSLSDMVKNNNQKLMEVNEQKSEQIQNDRSISGNTYFNPNLLPGYLDAPLKANNCINIKGYLDPVEFMNELYDTLLIHLKKKKILTPDDKKLKFRIDITEETENDEREITMVVKLYECSNGHILIFIQKEGNRKDFLDEFQVISDLVQKIIS